MAIKNRVDRLEKDHQAKQPPGAFDLFSVYPGLGLPEEVREAARSYMRDMSKVTFSELSETKEFRELLEAFPEYRQDIKSTIRCLYL